MIPSLSFALEQMGSELAEVEFLSPLRAVRAFDRFHGGPIRGADEKTIDAFRRWLLAQGYTRNTTQLYVGVARELLRATFPAGPWRTRRVVWRAAQSHAHVPGTLDHAITKRFRGRRPLRAPHTRRRYRAAVQLFSEQLGRPARVEDLTKSHVQAYVRWLVEERGYAEWTAANHTKRIASLWNWAAKARLVDERPTWK